MEDTALRARFPVLNIFLGVIWNILVPYASSVDKEVALRLAMGSSRRGIFSYLMYEGILLLTLAALPGGCHSF